MNAMPYAGHRTLDSRCAEIVHEAALEADEVLPMLNDLLFDAANAFKMRALLARLHQVNTAVLTLTLEEEEPDDHTVDAAYRVVFFGTNPPWGAAGDLNEPRAAA